MQIYFISILTWQRGSGQLQLYHITAKYFSPCPFIYKLWEEIATDLMGEKNKPLYFSQNSFLSMFTCM